MPARGCLPRCNVGRAGFFEALQGLHVQSSEKPCLSCMQPAGRNMWPESPEYKIMAALHMGFKDINAALTSAGFSLSTTFRLWRAHLAIHVSAGHGNLQRCCPCHTAARCPFPGDTCKPWCMPADTESQWPSQCTLFMTLHGLSRATV